MTLSFLRNRVLERATDTAPETVEAPLVPDLPAETESRRTGPFSKSDDVHALYRAADAAGGATAMMIAD
ncbi:branched-chain amino acid aminotransferase [Fulvimarina pelagi HTCC2506]|uniref:Branched-chain amino acid aminotransferase n=1 Tax=Fulvimarina pelagi HTCC2506 TaxID=314231 RepID=Q0G3N0_9HYPH|nr:hypothetical protein [Fulvimarina pelagi]EAU41801.1 branched-chain amino acid aminotransferase [Fulvimarina pelagi HTCC2506]